MLVYFPRMERAGSINIELKLVGRPRLFRDGAEAALPASRKTRALLAYLALANRPLRRDHLCTIFWEIPDDPKGGLRWSLSKLRGLLDDPVRPRLHADRDTVRLDCDGIDIDCTRLRAVATRDAASQTVAALRSVSAIDGEFLEGLELSHCAGFQAWAIAQREDVRRWQCSVAGALAERSDDNEEALAAARSWVSLAPYDANARTALIALLERTGRHGEVDGQRTLAVQQLHEGHQSVPRDLLKPAPFPTEASRHPSAAPLLDQEVRFCTASDGTGLAWSAVGKGFPLVKTANWLNHLEYDFHSPVWRHWISGLTQDHCLIRYDERGNGLSDWDTPDISFDAFVDDLTSVVDASGVDRFDLLGASQGCSVAIAYAVRHPGRVRNMVLYGGYATGWRVRADPGEVARRTAMATLMREGWGQNNPAFRQMYTTLFFPEASQAVMDWFNELQRVTTSPANAERLQDAFADIDVRSLVEKVSVPTLVLHARDDAVVPFQAGRSIATAIPDARFVALESRNHLLLESEPAWQRFLSATNGFLA